MFITKRLTVRDTKRVYVYLPNNILGYGTSSEVYKGKDQETDTFVAIKAIYKDKYEDLGIAEVRIHKAVPSHPHIVKFLGCCQTQDNLYIITELCEGGNLRKMLNEAPNRRIKEPLAVQYLAAVVDALCVIHEEGIIHRDVKPENLFFQNGIIKLGDFGSATYADLTISHKGSPQYLAPEMMVSCVLPYDNLIDVWALGIIFYEMLYGDLPTKEGIEKLCGKGDPQENIKGYEVSVEARELLKEMLMSDPNHRITMKKVKEHALFKKHEAMKEESFLLMQGIKEVLMDKVKSAEILELLKANKLQVSIESETNELVFELEESPLKRM